MKIFNWNWINLKLQPSCTNYSQVPQEKDIVLDHEIRTKKKAAMAIGETEKETKALLLHDMLNGVLTIGTLGHRHPDHLLLPPITYTDFADGDVDDDLPPAMEPALPEQKEGLIMTAMSAAAKLSDQEIKTTELKPLAAAPAETPETEKTILESPLLRSEQVRTTTLADLFAADPSINYSKGMTIDLGSGNYRNCSPNNRYHQSKADHQKKKLEMELSKNKMEKSKSTSKEIQKLITRMLKKKIHPETAAAGAGAVKEAEAEAAKPSRSCAAAGPEASHGLDHA